MSLNIQLECDSCLAGVGPYRPCYCSYLREQYVHEESATAQAIDRHANTHSLGTSSSSRQQSSSLLWLHTPIVLAFSHNEAFEQQASFHMGSFITYAFGPHDLPSEVFQHPVTLPQTQSDDVQDTGQDKSKHKPDGNHVGQKRARKEELENLETGVERKKPKMRGGNAPGKKKVSRYFLESFRPADGRGKHAKKRWQLVKFTAAPG